MATMMALSLCACGGGSTTQTEPAPEASVSEPVSEPIEEVNKENVLYLNKTETIGDYEFTVTGTEFTHVRRLSNGNYSAGEGNVYLIMYFNIKNIGKTEVSPTISCEVEYSDGFIFEEDFSMLSMAPLSDASDNSIAITVPSTIKDDYTSNLKIVIKGHPLGVEEDYTYYLLAT